MNLILNIIVLIFEVLYYSLFMKFARKEGKFWKYILLFLLISILFFFVGTNQVYSYLILIIMMLFGLKYVVKTETSLYDMFLIVIMIFIKFVIEFATYLLLFKLLSINHFITTLVFEILKISFAISLRKYLLKANILLKNLWDNNNFYIRYIFSIAMFIYVIITIILKLIVPFVK